LRCDLIVITAESETRTTKSRAAIRRSRAQHATFHACSSAKC